MHKLFKRVNDAPSSGSQSPAATGKDNHSSDEEFFDPKQVNDDETSSNGTRRSRNARKQDFTKSESESEGRKTPRGYNSEDANPPRVRLPTSAGGVSITSSGKRSTTESSYPDDEQYETCEDQSIKDNRPVVRHRSSPDESRYYSNSDTGSSYTQLKNFAGLSSTLLPPSKPRGMSIDDQMSQVSSLSSMSMEPISGPGTLAGLAFLNQGANNNNGTVGSGGGTGTRHNSQDTEPSYALSALQDEVGASSGVEDEYDRRSMEKDTGNESSLNDANLSQHRNGSDENLNNDTPNNNRTQTNETSKIANTGEPNNNSSSSNNNNQHQKMQSDDEKRIMQALFSLHPQEDAITTGGSTTTSAAHRLSNSSNSSENQFYTQSIKVTSTMPDNRVCLFKEKLRLVQTLKPHEGSIWTMKFSPNGHYLSTGGQDMKVMIWAVGRLPHHHAHHSAENRESAGGGSGSNSAGNGEGSGERRNGNDDSENEDFLDEDNDSEESDNNNKNNKRDSVNDNADDGEETGSGIDIDQFVYPHPYRIFEGHSGDVIDISWSKSNFILSASMDLTVRLWHVTRNECLQYFKHPDVVTCVEFHPIVDRYFITGCFDRKLRVWDIIPDGTVKEWAQATDTITSISFSPDGSTVASGLIQGQIFFYEYEGLKYKTQIDCRNRNGKYKKGTKVTGMCFNVKKDAFQQMQQQHNSSGAGTGDNDNNSSYPPRRPKSTNKMPDLLISTNDSRIRYCRLEDYSFTCKYKGLTNKTMQIKATFSDDGRLIISGSEDGMVYIWRANEDASSRRYSMFKSSDIQRNTFYESFSVAYDNAATVVSVFAPSESVKHFVRAQEKLLEILKRTSQSRQMAPDIQQLKDPQKRNSKTFRGLDVGNKQQRGRESFISTDPSSGIGGAYDTSCRVIATADSDGYMRFFFRLS